MSISEGPSALCVSKEDATAPARILAEFAKTANKLEMKAGVIEGTVYDVAGLNELAKIPSREVLLSKLLGSLQSPITNFARVIKQIAEKDGEAATEASGRRSGSRGVKYRCAGYAAQCKKEQNLNRRSEEESGRVNLKMEDIKNG